MCQKIFLRLFTIFTFILLVSAAFLESRDSEKPNIYISADIEGIAGVVKAAFGPRDFEYEKARRLMSAEVYAAIEGCLEAGAGEIVVSDSHGNCLNITPDELHEAAVLVRSFPRPLDMMDGINETFDGVIFIGYHPKEGTALANISHTMFGRFFEIRLNGMAVSEAIFNAAIAGHFNVPIIMITGDQHVAREARKTFGPVETVVSKESRGYFSAKSPHPNVIKKEIKEKSKRAVQRINEIKPFHLESPIKMEMIFKHTIDAEALSYFPWFKRKNAKTIHVGVDNMIEAAGIIIGLGSINTR